jgi:hypothetical protein
MDVGPSLLSAAESRTLPPSELILYKVDSGLRPEEEGEYGEGFDRYAVKNQPKRNAPGPPTAPPAAEGEAGEEAGPTKTEGKAEKDYSHTPSSLHVMIPGTWQTSKRAWKGIVDGTLHGDQVVQFLKAMDGKGDMEDAIMTVCEDFDEQFASALEIENSSWSTPQY